ncbi:hypothetical protein D3C78_1710320 [compost metagenome]
MFVRVVEAQLLREDQRTARQQRLANPREQFQALLGGDELQGEVHCHHRGRLELQSKDIALDHLDRQQLLEHRVLGIEVLPAALDHGCRVVDGDHPATVAAHVAAQGLRHRPQ